MAVLGRLNESGEEERLSLSEGGRGRCGRLMDSRLRREKSVLRVSNLGRITVSRYAVRTIRRTSSTWLAGTLAAAPLELVWGFEGEERGRAPQKERAWSCVMRGPWPENSRSSGRKTACIYGKMDVNVKSHSSTRCGISRSSEVRRSV